MKNFQKRVIAEKTELDGRLERLATFLLGDVFAGLSSAEQARLTLQHVIMTAYSAVLGQRIAAFKTPEAE